MINETQKSKIVRFLDDEVMSDTVKQMILSSFMKSRPEKDVYYLAAKSLSIEFLEDAWRDLYKYKSEDLKEKNVAKQVGL